LQLCTGRIEGAEEVTVWCEAVAGATKELMVTVNTPGTCLGTGTGASLWVMPASIVLIFAGGHGADRVAGARLSRETKRTSIVPNHGRNSPSRENLLTGDPATAGGPE